MGGSQTSPSLAHTRDEVKSSSSSVVSCHAVSIHSLVVSVCPSSQVFLVLLVLQCCVDVHRGIRTTCFLRLRIITGLIINYIFIFYCRVYLFVFSAIDTRLIPATDVSLQLVREC